MKVASPLLALIVTAWALTGCAAMAKYDQGPTTPMAATWADLSMMGQAMSGPPEDRDPNAFDFLYSPFAIPLFVVDLPFSITWDLLTLPRDLYCKPPAQPMTSQH